MATNNNRTMTIHELLGQYRERISNPRDLGTIFEKLTKTYFERDPIYAARFRKVWFWNDWPQRWGPDCGIDLVAEDVEGNYCAIQCKFYAGDYTIVKEDIDSFFTESGREFKIDGKNKISFSYRVIVTTTNRWSDNAQRSIKNQTIPVTLIGLTNFDESPIEWSSFDLDKPDDIVLKEKKKLRPHQNEAIKNVLDGYKTKDRGKLIMACGTGKTFTALKLAEQVAKKDGVVLFLVPSISLLSQTLREWAAESAEPFNAFAVCSDRTVGKNNEDMTSHDLAIPATTDTSSLIEGLEKLKKTKRMTVVFSTYQSIEVVSKAQKKGLPEFDIIICDEAHRTTGVTLEDEEESHFVKVHDQKYIKGKKRLYMTATPRIFAEAAKTKADEANAVLCSMDDESVFGPEFHRLGFGKAVGDNLLTDYKVLVLAVDEKVIDGKFQRKFANEDGEIPLEDIVKIIGCWNGLSKKFVGEEAVVEDNRPMKRAVGFARAIKDSKKIAAVFQGVVQEYIKKNPISDKILNCELDHVDGTFNVFDRNARLDWLKADTPDNTCRILTNARCLSEGVDVPALDAVIFLNPRDSMVDVVQSVGRIMRRAEGKKYGYVILPIGIPAGVPPEIALKDNKKYKVVWQVLQALRAHDDRFDAEVNKIDLNKGRSSTIQVIGVGGGGDSEDGKTKGADGKEQIEFNMPEIEDWKDAIYAKIVIKCGSRPYWENWANDVAKIAEKHTEHIKKLLKSQDPKPKKAFEKYLNGIRKNINPSISEDDAVEMLSQHLITKPVFDALFEHYQFTEKNPVSQSLQAVLKVLEAGTFKEDAAKLKGFYDSVRMRVKGIDNPEARQKIIVELYDRFFKIAFPKMSKRLGIIYTPVELVDFIILSVETIMRSEFGKGLTDENVHILDPFTGTGTFLVRLLQSGVVDRRDLARKYRQELHANEIVLLAYYIAAINIEESLHGILGGEYKPFNGVILADTFQLNEAEVQPDLVSSFPENSDRAQKQKSLDLRVIVGNPPYASGDKDDENNKNIDYPSLDERITKTYVAQSSRKMGKSKMYDSYIRAIRWASDRIANNGVIGFVTGSGFIEKPSMNGIRKCLAQEFSSIYVFNLRGDIRKNILSKGKALEGQNVFSEGSMTGIAITFFIKNPKSNGRGKIYYHDIGDDLKTSEKLSIISNLKCVSGISDKGGWTEITPDGHCDWIDQRNSDFEDFVIMGDKSNGNTESIFSSYSMGIKTNRDAWVYGFSKKHLTNRLKSMITFYNEQVESQRGQKAKDIEKNLDRNKTKIKWTTDVQSDLLKGKLHHFKSDDIVVGLYRPFCKSWVYANADWNWTRHLMPKYFSSNTLKNVVICVSGVGARSGFSALISNVLPDLEIIEKGQCFPLHVFEPSSSQIELTGSIKDTLTLEKAVVVDKTKPSYVRRDGISDFGLKQFQEFYSGEHLGKEDLFYYIYGLLHSPDYRSRYVDNLTKELPRIPRVKKSSDFWSFSKAGRELADLHLNYETAKCYPVQIVGGMNQLKSFSDDDYRVIEMKFAKKGEKTTVIYNRKITMTGIPEEAFEYIVNGKPALEWVMERQAVTSHKDSGIVNDANIWATETIGNAKYPLELFQRIITVSLETNRIVSELPNLELLPEKK